MRKSISRRTAIALEMALGLIIFASIVSGCFQTVGAALDVTATPGQSIPALQFTPSPPPAVQPTAFVIQPTQTTAGLFPPTSAPTPVAPVAVAQAATATQDNSQLFNDPAVTETLVQMTRNAQATQILAGVTQTAEFENTLAATQLGTGLPPGVAPVVATPIPGQPAVAGTPQGTPGAPGSGAAGTITGDCIYTVVEGDRIFRIALRFGLTTAQVARANGIVNADLISVGQRLTIPDCNTPKTPVPVPAAGVGDTTGGTATAGAPATTGASGQNYVVQEGDTLYGIATKFGVKVMALAQANNITNINLIYIGQTLVIP